MVNNLFLYLLLLNQELPNYESLESQWWTMKRSKNFHSGSSVDVFECSTRNSIDVFWMCLAQWETISPHDLHLEKEKLHKNSINGQQKGIK